MLSTFLRNYWHKQEGIVTLADHNYFPGLEMLYQSVQQSYSVPIACFDVGLTEEQRAYAQQAYPDLQILPLPQNHAIQTIQNKLNQQTLKKPGKREWPLWICPFLIAASPFRYTFWLDCDILVLRDLAGLFALLREGPVFTSENLAPEVTANKPALYDLLPISRDFDPNQPAVNGGVSGWDLVRDKAALQAYMYPIEQAWQNPDVKTAISWHDQGSLIWAIQKLGLEKRVQTDLRWNLCVKHTQAFGKKYSWDVAGLEILRNDVPEANLLHWNGTTVPWRL